MPRKHVELDLDYAIAGIHDEAEIEAIAGDQAAGREHGCVLVCGYDRTERLEPGWGVYRAPGGDHAVVMAPGVAEVLGLTEG
jgi:hypothetical protein